MIGIMLSMAEEELLLENLCSMLNFNEKWNRKLYKKNNWIKS